MKKMFAILASVVACNFALTLCAHAADNDKNKDKDKEKVVCELRDNLGKDTNNGHEILTRKECRELGGREVPKDSK